MNKIILPRSHKGRPYISNSQANSWHDLKSFNLGIKGRQEYMLGYFFDKEFPDIGWGEFGHDVEDYIRERKNPSKFNPAEKEILEQITPLGRYEVEGYLNMGDFDVKLFIDDATEDLSKIRDYKTASDRSRKKYYKDDYYQLDIYGAWVEQETGNSPEMELCIIERGGNCMFGGSRASLFVKDRVWYHERHTNFKRQQYIRDYLLRTAQEISEAYKVYLKMNSYGV